MLHAQHVACYDSESVDRPILSDDFFLIECKMQMRGTRKAYGIYYQLPESHLEEI